MPTNHKSPKSAVGLCLFRGPPLKMAVFLLGSFQNRPKGGTSKNLPDSCRVLAGPKLTWIPARALQLPRFMASANWLQTVLTVFRALLKAYECIIQDGEGRGAQ